MKTGDTLKVTLTSGRHILVTIMEMLDDKCKIYCDDDDSIGWVNTEQLKLIPHEIVKPMNRNGANI